MHPSSEKVSSDFLLFDCPDRSWALQYKKFNNPEIKTLRKPVHKKTLKFQNLHFFPKIKKK